jgi:hypothetical protein
MLNYNSRLHRDLTNIKVCAQRPIDAMVGKQRLEKVIEFDRNACAWRAA